MGRCAARGVPQVPPEADRRGAVRSEVKEEGRARQGTDRGTFAADSAPLGGSRADGRGGRSSTD
jgi:hypothetical protein